MRIRTRGYVYMVLSLMLGALFPVVLAFAKGVDIFEFFMLSYALAIPFALLLVIRSKKQKAFLAYMTDLKRLCLITFIGLLTYSSIGIGLFYAEQSVSASLATVVFRTSPLLMLLLLPTVLNEKLSKSQFAALGLAFLSIYVALSGGQPGWVLDNANVPIILLLLVAAFAYALGAVLIRKYVFDMESAMLIFNLTLFSVFAVLYVTTGISPTQLQLRQIGAILYVGIFTNVASFYMYFNSLRVLKMTIATNILFLSPFITLLFANLLLGETIQPYYLIIALLVGVGLIIQKYDKVGGTYRAKQSEKLKNFTIFDVSGAFANTEETAVANALKDGGRVLAVKLPQKHKESIMAMTKQRGHNNVFTDGHESMRNEITFVKEVTGASNDDVILLKAGDMDEGEAFFGEVADIVELDAPDGI